jgi:hypothetical protein
VVDRIAYFAPNRAVAPSLEPASIEPTPSAVLTPTTETHVAQLEVTGSGRVGCISYDNCWAWLVLSRTPSVANWQPGPNDPVFAADRDGSGLTLQGPVRGAPSTIAVGSWTVAIADVEYSDAGTCNTSPCTSPSFPVVRREILCTQHFVVSPDTDLVSISADFGPPCGINVSLQTSKAATAPPTTAPTDAATAACAAIIDNIPLVRVRSGQATIAAAYEVTGEQMTRYFITALHHSDMSNGADWWHDPSRLVDMCVFEGDFITMTPGPSPSGDITPTGNVGPTVTRVLVVIDNGNAEYWASGVPLTDPASIPAATSGSPSAP